MSVQLIQACCCGEEDACCNEGESCEDCPDMPESVLVSGTYEERPNGGGAVTYSCDFAITTEPDAFDPCVHYGTANDCLGGAGAGAIVQLLETRANAGGTRGSTGILFGGVDSYALQKCGPSPYGSYGSGPWAARNDAAVEARYSNVVVS